MESVMQVAETRFRASGTGRVMEPTPSDAAYLARSLAEPTAFEPIFDRHFTAIHRYLHRRAGRDVADELSAETFALAFEQRASCRARDSVLPWLYGIATNLLRRRRRAERRRLRAYGRSGVDVWADYEDDAAARLDGFSLGARLARALLKMRPRERDALLLYALADLSYAEIAVALDVPVGTVRTWLHRARRIAQRELAAETSVFPLATTGADG
jgi:RNA polymerase sigma factor (sigma-70 family)